MEYMKLYKLQLLQQQANAKIETIEQQLDEASKQFEEKKIQNGAGNSSPVMIVENQLFVLIINY
jgi:hypothetical protein